MGTQASKAKQGMETGMKGRFGSQMSYPEKVKLRKMKVAAAVKAREIARKKANANAKRRATLARKKKNESAEKSGAGTSGK